MRVIIVRHGKTQGNIERRYVGGRTDQPLAESGRAALRQAVLPEDGDEGSGLTMLFTSPMKRAVETAGIMFPDLQPAVIEELRETDFGIFEGHNYAELTGDPAYRDDYQAWLDSGGLAKIPGGESMEEARARSLRGFSKAVGASHDAGAATVIITAHGGTVMSVMSSLFGGDYYDYYADNGEGYIFRVEVDDAGNITAAGTYDSFCGGIHS